MFMFFIFILLVNMLNKSSEGCEYRTWFFMFGETVFSTRSYSSRVGARAKKASCIRPGTKSILEVLGIKFSFSHPPFSLGHFIPFFTFTSLLFLPFLSLPPVVFVSWIVCVACFLLDLYYMYSILFINADYIYSFVWTSFFSN